MNGNQSALKVAFVGLGIMGGSMAANLARKGFAVRGWNRTPGKPGVLDAQQAGVFIADDLPQAVHEADFVFLCLTDVDDLKECLFGTGGIAPGLRKGSIVVDMSTTGPQCAVETSSQLASAGIGFLDAPVSGGDVGAREGTLTIMVGGAQADFERCKPLFEAMGKNIWHCGEAGSGQAVKLCNQILCAVNLTAVCEAFQLADQLGIERSFVVDVCKSGAAGSWSLANLGPRILKDDFSPGFKIKDMLKDLRLVMESLPSGSLPSTALARDRLFQAKSIGGAGGADQGTQAIMRTYQS